MFLVLPTTPDPRPGLPSLPSLLIRSLIHSRSEVPSLYYYYRAVYSSYPDKNLFPHTPPRTSQVQHAMR